jgi:CheY-like chemotaxis protein
MGGDTKAMAMEMHRVLVAEDDVLLARTIAAILDAELACRSVLAYDGASALHALQVARFELVLLDIDSQDLDGLALYGRVHAALVQRDLPVLFVTELVPWPVLARADILHYLRKPFDFWELVTQVSLLLGLPGGLAGSSARQTP